MFTYIRANTNHLSTWNDYAMFKLIFSELHIMNSEFIGQKRLFSSFVGIINMVGNTIRDTTLILNMATMSNTELNLVDTTISNITQDRKWISLFYCSIDSVLNVENFVFRDSEMTSFTVRSSTFISKDVTFSNIRSESRLLIFQEMQNIVMENW